MCFHDRPIVACKFGWLLKYRFPSSHIEPIPAVDAILNCRVSNIIVLEQGCLMPAIFPLEQEQELFRAMQAGWNCDAVRRFRAFAGLHLPQYAR
jgi:hypothetical protein